jgi:hypothetical protein
MRVDFTSNGPLLKVELFPDELDLEFSNGRFVTANRSFSIHLPNGYSMSDIHSDHLALIGVMAAFPFTKGVLELSLDVSQRFIDGFKALRRFKITPNSNEGPIYSAPNPNKAALAFSGGIDSTAVLCLMPKDTALVFLDRPKRLMIRSLYDKSAPLAILDYAESQGYDVFRVNCDVEYIRNPVGFPVDLAAGIPAIAIASILGYSSVAFGTVMESAFRIGHDVARTYADSSHHRLWGNAFKNSGLFLTLPVSGVSEVGTSLIVEASSFSNVSYSCIRGKWPKPCENCWKCFRKSLVESRIKNQRIDEKRMGEWLKVKEVRLKLSKRLISHENVLSWALSGQNVIGKSANGLRNRLEGMRRDLDHLTRWFPPSLDHVHESHRNLVEERLNQYLGRMSESEITDLLKHDIREWLSESESMNNYHKFLKINGLEVND